MANTKSAAKRTRQTKIRTTRNRQTVSKLKTLSKRAGVAFDAKDKTSASKEVRALSSTLDRAVKSGALHRNSANRRKSILARKLATI